MTIQDRVLVLTEAEQASFYGPPSITVNDQRYFFALNDQKRSIAKKFRVRNQRPIRLLHSAFMIASIWPSVNLDCLIENSLSFILVEFSTYNLCSFLGGITIIFCHRRSSLAG